MNRHHTPIALRVAQAAHSFPMPFGCAQAIAAAYGHGANQELMSMLGALSGGVGGCGLTCGAFTGGAMVLTSELQRLGYNQARCSGMIDELRLRFELADETTSCYELTGLRFGDEEIITACRARIERTLEHIGAIVACAGSKEQGDEESPAPHGQL